ncbi:MAG: peptidoglycan DD-metalloendopeptidase family protein [Clostridia bacterium]|nr:peptidoglycan DD-metalloendopeptidase family protein [Clostridia bacterium]MBR6575251.1 peptidoglycan DD-metalloendopeptidase family protein [Clostridia bacterium]
MKQNNKPTAYERKLNRSRRVVQIVAILLAALMIGSVLLSALPVFGITKSEVDALKKKVNEASAKKKELKSQVSALSGDISSLEKQISLLDGQIEAQEDEIAAQEELLAQLEILVEEKTIELAASEEDQANQYARMKERVRYMVEHDSTSQLAILLASDSFADFLNRWEIVQQISVRDEKLFEELQAIRDKVTVEKQELEATQAEAIETKALMDANKAELDAQHASKVKALQKAEAEKAAANKAYADMIEKEEDLMEQYKKAAAQLASQSTYVGGKFMWPLPAANNVITCKYGYRTHPVTKKYKLHTGIDLRASTGTKVYAANKGTVTTSGYSSAWGNYIIINHGGGYTTLYAHLSRRNVSKGATVKQGDVIGLSGNTGYSTGPHLHFEINKNGSSYDPLKEFKGFNYVFK